LELSADPVFLAGLVSVPAGTAKQKLSSSQAAALHLNLSGAVPIIRLVEEEVDIANHACIGVQL